MDEVSRRNFKSTYRIGKIFWICIGNKRKSFTRYTKCVNEEKNVERQLVQSQKEDAQKRENDLELEMQNLTNIIHTTGKHSNNCQKNV